MVKKKSKAAISSGHPKTTEAGLEMFRLGGNAFDAALAAMLASCVAEPCTTSAGGGGFLLAKNENKPIYLLDFFSQTPVQRNPNKLDFYPVDIKIGSATQQFHIGMASTTVPGFISGWFDTYKRHASLPADVLAAPAIDYARNGLEISTYQYTVFDMLAPISKESKRGRELFFNKTTNKLKTAGTKLYLSNFADFLEELIKEGKDAFYLGEPAKNIIKESNQRGGHLIAEDFQTYQSILRKPLQSNYKNYQLFTNPPPCAGGLLIAFALSVIQETDFSQIKIGSEEHIKVLAKAIELTHIARDKSLTGALHNKNIINDFLDPELFNSIIADENNKRGSTTHISTADENGNAVSVTTSFGEGSGYIIPGTDIVLNNMLGEADLNPQGFHKWPTNTRMSSMMSPTMVLNNKNEIEIVTGSGGSNRIRTALFQVLHLFLDYELELNKVVNSPRIHHENNTLYLEPGFSENVYRMNEYPNKTTWDKLHHFFGGAHTISNSGINGFQAIGDERRNGFGATWK